MYAKKSLDQQTCCKAHLPQQKCGLQVLWDAETGHPICGTPTANNFTNAARFFSQDSLCIATGGNYNLTVWEYNIPGNKLVPHEVQLGQMRRIVTCLDIDQDDRYMYCGTTTGDVLQVRPQITWWDQSKHAAAQVKHSWMAGLGQMCAHSGILGRC